MLYALYARDALLYVPTLSVAQAISIRIQSQIEDFARRELQTWPEDFAGARAYG